MTSEEFKKQYSRLNKAQREAVDTIEGPVMVSAGPGTGKTQILALRIANILLKTDTKPENILCLTFTESGVFSMRRRLAEMMGNAAYKVAINTFHGFCNDIIKERSEDFPKIIGSTNINEVDQIKILEELLTTLPLDKLRPWGEPLHYLKDAKSAIGQLKQEGIRPDKFAQATADEEKAFWQIEDLYSTKKGYEGKLKTKYQSELKMLEKNKELAQVYQAYEDKLREKKLYDYSDMILETVEALERDKNLLLSLQETYQYILVDEHQDTNNGQNKVLELLASFYDNPNLFVVGDEKQAIFRFQGASLENFLYFRHKWPEAKLVVLEENYRSTQNILDSAHSLLSGDKRLRANRDYANRPLERAEFSTQFVEEYFVSSKIKELVAGGEKPEEIAVLYRDNKDAFLIAEMLGRVGVPFTIESNQDILADSDVRKLVKLLRAVHYYGNAQAFLEALHIDFLDIDTLDLYKFISLIAKEKLDPLSAVRRPDFLREHGLEQPEKIQRAEALIAKFAQLAKNENIAVVFADIVRESGLLHSVLNSPAGVEKIDKINTLFDEVKALIENRREVTLADFVAHLEMLAEHEIYLKKTIEGVKTGRVRLMTAHGAKGLEFDHVFIIYGNDKHWGNRRRLEKIKLPKSLFALVKKNDDDGEDENSDERRLFYVALTRAKQTATITCSRQDKNKRELAPSQFLTELDQALVTNIDPAEYEQKYLENSGIIYQASATKSAGVRDRDFVRELFQTRGLSVTHLNNYLDCPWKYFYVNLLRLPQAEERYLMYGTAIHGALQDFFGRLADEPDTNKDYLLLRYRDHLAREPIPKADWQEYLERGEKALGGYFDAYHSAWRTRVLTEFNIKGVILSPEIVLTGKIDKLEFLGDGGEVNVVDYKTGGVKSRGVIEGETKNSEGNIKRQLAFYNLLLNKYEDGKYKMISADVDFVEPNDRGIYKKESFVVLPEEVAELEELILKVSAEILGLDFWDKRCDDKKCEFCALREMLN